MLGRAFRRLKRSAAPGETVSSYEQDLAENLRALHERVHTGRYRPQPVRRVFIPKADGSQRPLGVPTLEDKIVQSAVAEILSAVYEADFLGFSYGFRPGRDPHQALSALHTAMMTQYVNWVLDADVRSFFDSVDHEWLMRMVAHRIADTRILRLVRGWLEAGVMTGAELQDTDKGVPQGAGISPLLANVFSPLRTRSVGPSVASPQSSRACRHRPVLRRLRDGLPARGGRSLAVGGAPEPPRVVQARPA
jgi:group II intron reverse transcriptase/maturase